MYKQRNNKVKAEFTEKNVSVTMIENFTGYDKPFVKDEKYTVDTNIAIFLKSNGYAV